MDINAIMTASSTVMPLDTGIKEAYGHVEEGTAFNRSFEDVISGSLPEVSSIQSQLSTLPTAINGVADSIISKASSIGPQIDSALARIPAFQAHVADQFNNLMNNISTFASSQGLTNALAGNTSGGCGQMTKWFGSITTEGPKLIAEVKGLADQIKGEINNFKQLGQDLQGHITATKTELMTKLDQTIAATPLTNTAKLTSLNDMKTRLTAEFQSGVASARVQLTKDAMALLPAGSTTNAQKLLTQMRNTDFSISSASDAISGFAGKLDGKSASLESMITSEKSASTTAVKKLEQLGAVSSMKGLISSNPCVQTLMGFVGNSSFLKSLGS